MNRVGGASTAASSSLCAKGTASSSRACASSTRGRPRAAATRSRSSRNGRSAAASKRAEYSRPCGPPGRAVRALSSSSSPASSEAPSAGQSSTSERKSPAGRAPPAAACSRPCWPRAPPATGRRTRASSHLAGGDGVPPAVRSHLAAALAVAAEVERQRGQSGRRRLLAHQLVVLLAAAGAVAHEQGAGRPAGRPEEPAGQLDAVRCDGDRLAAPGAMGRTDVLVTERV